MRPLRTTLKRIETDMVDTHGKPVATFGNDPPNEILVFVLWGGWLMSVILATTEGLSGLYPIFLAPLPLFLANPFWGKLSRFHLYEDKIISILNAELEVIPLDQVKSYEPLDQVSGKIGSPGLRIHLRDKSTRESLKAGASQERDAFVKKVRTAGVRYGA